MPLILNYSCAIAQNTEATPTTSWHSRLLPKDKVILYSELALSGDFIATEKLISHYCISDHNEKCFEWLRIDYENKLTKKSQRELADFLLFKINKDNKNLVRGIFWLKRSMNKNNPDDVAKLKEAEEALKSQRHFNSTK